MIKQSIQLYPNNKLQPIVYRKTLTKDIIEEHLDYADTQDIREKAIFTHKKNPKHFLEIIDFQLDPSKIFMYKGEPAFVRVKEHYNNTICVLTNTISEILDTYEYKT